MIYDLEIRPYNLEAHKDIAIEMLKKRNGLFTINLRVNKSNIVDLVTLEYLTYGDSKPTT